ncbi:phage/plasmid replication protein, II/X family [Pasteurella atlantica]|uniref:Phage/plasmid replication protein, gene II/X family n=1 Tax=Phocoenobacter skyensis TaxID=97481 RepID=A0A1H7VLA8_9PAST|nr:MULTISPECIES: phage/plasmid replication protein, II/X family [Pasteurella]MDP8033614.1 phage/plasmid replication protein, II/X family [Pasteurella atlantica]MDP8035606.1 phage/plasmid replication protein, II/X family [Pasteurella atlantica]MDP8037557.1 phage/plasmid replication protein, II/X family [Pasteurella atlantica]MDP8047906.1 phage/plasmid replication protein, II/X family [Pasteurella atlantica]MDP8049861.1 phage/plasmid replication protein, II/X family [Pasteurella atlantica]
MIDFLKISISFKESELLILNDGETAFLKTSLEVIAKKSGLKLSAGNVSFEIDGDLHLSELRHPYEQLPSHFSTLAIKIWQGSDNLSKMPFLELKASPAKLLQGHNVFGSTNIELCAFEMLNTLAVGRPELYEMLDISSATVDWIDVTYSAHIPNDSLQKQLIAFLKNIHSGQSKQTRFNRDYETTVCWNTGSRRRTLKAYLKGYELHRRIGELQNQLMKCKSPYLMNSLNILTDIRLQEFAKKCVRFEARLLQRYLNDKHIPRNLFDLINYQKAYEKNGEDLIKDLWIEAFKDIFDAIGETKMNVYNEEKIINLLRKNYLKITPKGNVSYSKADRLYGFYERLLDRGYDNVYRSMSRETFRRNLYDLMAIGLTKAQLQNLKSKEKNNIIPFMKLVEIDFTHQKPSWYIEPNYTYLKAA